MRSPYYYPEWRVKKLFCMRQKHTDKIHAWVKSVKLSTIGTFLD